MIKNLFTHRVSSEVDVTAGASATLVLDADPTRVKAHLKGLGTNTQSIRVGGPEVAANRGAQLNPGGEGVTIHGIGPIYAIREADGVVDVTITTEHT